MVCLVADCPRTCCRTSSEGCRGGESFRRRGSVMRCHRHEQRVDGRVHGVRGRPTVPCAAPARHLHARAPPGSLGECRLPSEWALLRPIEVACAPILAHFFTGDKSTQSGNLTWRFSAVCEAALSYRRTDPVEEMRTSHRPRFPRLLSPFFLSCPFFRYGFHLVHHLAVFLLLLCESAWWMALTLAGVPWAIRHF